MSFGRPPTFSTFQVSPPERGSFPLDHEGTLLISSNAGDCTAPMREYLACLKVHKNNNGECRHLSKAYLQCRMDNGLMERDNMDNLGFADVDKHRKAQAKQAPSARIV